MTDCAADAAIERKLASTVLDRCFHERIDERLDESLRLAQDRLLRLFDKLGEQFRRLCACCGKEALQWFSRQAATFSRRAECNSLLVGVTRMTDCAADAAIERLPPHLEGVTMLDEWVALQS